MRSRGGFAYRRRVDGPVAFDDGRAREGRHGDFYAAQAERRLAEPGAQRWVHTALRSTWAPVGSNVMPNEETDRLVESLFGGDAGRLLARRVDDRTHRLPGLDGLDLISGVCRSVAA